MPVMWLDSTKVKRPASQAPVWEASDTPLWYLWEGGFLLLGRGVAVVPVHDHHAVQIVISCSEAVSICGADGIWQDTHGLIVKPDTPHGFDGRGAFGAMLFIDPESSEGLWMRSFLKEPITLVPQAQLETCTQALRTFVESPFEALEVGALIRYCVHSLCRGVPPSRNLDARISKVLNKIRSSANLRISLEESAASVFLSPGRFAHLFKQQVGLPYRRYMLWRKLARAMLVIGRENSIAAAAQDADFSDAAHLTRTFQQMFGTSPSYLMRGEFFEIASPFEGAPH